MLKSKHRKKKRDGDLNGFEQWGGYMNAKITKLEAQFVEDERDMLANEGRTSNIFEGVSIFVNGFTDPSADELRCLMLQHGGVYHHYYRSGKTTHIIASSLPNAKFDQMKTHKIVKCEWITESIKAGRLLDYKNFLLMNDFPSCGKRDNVLMKLNAMLEPGRKDPELPKTAADDGYLSDFYKNSRLHYISTLGAMLKQHVQEMRETHDGTFPGRTRLQQQQQQNCSFLDGDDFDDTVIMHIDVDCFFVAVALRNRPHLIGQPVAVTHSKGKPPPEDRNVDRKFEVDFYRKKMKAKIQKEDKDEDEDDEDSVVEWAKDKSSMSEIASCSYEARKAGVRKGMYLGVALKLCPDLKTVPYDFDGYKEVSLTLYNTVSEYTLDIEAVSCDELFIDCSSLIKDTKVDPMHFAGILREEIHNKTKCTASVGIGINKLQARLATKHAKPNGQFYLTHDRVGEFMKTLDVGELPGVGRTISAKLKSLKVKTCEDLQNLPLNVLKKEFGEKTGETLYKNCRGEDDRKVNYSHERKSVSAEINYGIRFNDDEETETFLRKLCEEVSKRLKDVKMIGKNVTLKVLYRAKDAPVETAKFLGHGVCDGVNKSVALPIASDNAQVIGRHVIGLYHQLGIPANELRGIGIQVTKLENAKRKKTLRDFLNGKAETKTETKTESKTETETETKQQEVQPSTSRKNTVPVELPTASQIDPEVLASLPEDIRQEVLKEYGLSGGKETKPQKTAQSTEDVRKELLNLSLADMRTMIREWVTQETRPQPFDVETLKSYLSGLVADKNLETLSIVIKCLSRWIKERREGDEVWNETYDEVVDTVQKSMMEVFGKVLASEVVL